MTVGKLSLESPSSRKIITAKKNTDCILFKGKTLVCLKLPWYFFKWNFENDSCIQKKIIIINVDLCICQTMCWFFSMIIKIRAMIKDLGKNYCNECKISLILNWDFNEMFTITIIVFFFFPVRLKKAMCQINFV